MKNTIIILFITAFIFMFFKVSYDVNHLVLMDKFDQGTLVANNVYVNMYENNLDLNKEYAMNIKTLEVVEKSHTIFKWEVVFYVFCLTLAFSLLGYVIILLTWMFITKP